MTIDVTLRGPAWRHRLDHLPTLAYYVEAVVAPDGTARALAATRRSAHLVELGQGFCLVPVTAALIDELAPTVRSTQLAGRRDPQLPVPLAAALARLSQLGPVAYVEAAFCGGEGAQASVVWEGGRIVLGPPVESEDDLTPPPTEMAINRALRRLGAVRGRHFDEFDALRLGRIRRTRNGSSPSVGPSRLAAAQAVLARRVGGSRAQEVAERRPRQALSRHQRQPGSESRGLRSQSA